MFSAFLLFFKNNVSRTRDAGPKEEQAVEEAFYLIPRKMLGSDDYLAVPLKEELVESAEGCRVLILFPDRLFKHFHLDVTGFFSQLRRRDAGPEESVQGIEQPDGKTGGGTKSSGSGKVGDRADIDRGLDAHEAQAFASDAVFDIVQFIDTLGVGIIKAVVF